MTPEVAYERAKALVDQMYAVGADLEATEAARVAVADALLAVVKEFNDQLREVLAETERRVTAAITEAVSAERERCAKIAETVQTELGSDVYHDVGGMIAARIREGQP